MKNTKLRLLVTEKCNRHCEGCCNKDIKPSQTISVNDISGYDTIMITGGEPMLFPNKLLHFLPSILKKGYPSSTQVFIYTAKFPSPNTTEEEDDFYLIFSLLAGITFTIHDQEGIDDFINLNRFINDKILPFDTPYRRLNVFRDVKLPVINLYGWDVKFVDWIKDCPIPEGEDFFRLENLWE